MVIMELIPAIDCASLRGFLLEEDSPSSSPPRCCPPCLVLDCRSFFSFNSSHIPGSHNVRFSSIVRRRAGAGPRGGLGLEHIVPNEETRRRLLAGEYRRGVVFLDERSCDLGRDAKKDGTLMLAVAALRRDAMRGAAPVFYLKGGFDTFSSDYPELCTKPSPPQGGLILPLSASSHPDTAGCSPVNTPLYDQGGPVEILPFLYLGSAYHASRKDMLDMLGITALINVSANCPNHFEDAFVYKSIPVEDNYKADISSWFNEAIEFIDSMRNSGGRVFVHCQAGISRSATICLAYLMRTNRVKLDEAFEFVKQRRSIISPNFSFMGQLLQFESQVLASASAASAASSCSSEAAAAAASSPAIVHGVQSSTVFNFPVSIPVHSGAFLHSPITTSPSC